jgi:hypothetical protein
MPTQSSFGQFTCRRRSSLEPFSTAWSALEQPGPVLNRSGPCQQLTESGRSFFSIVGDEPPPAFSLVGSAGLELGLGRIVAWCHRSSTS